MTRRVLSFFSWTVFNLCFVWKQSFIFKPVVNNPLRLLFSQDERIPALLTLRPKKSTSGKAELTNFQTFDQKNIAFTAYIHFLVLFFYYVLCFLSFSSFLSFDITKILIHHIDKPRVSFSVGSLNFKNTSVVWQAWFSCTLIALKLF